MKRIQKLFLRLLLKFKRIDDFSSEERSFFDYSASEKIKILRAAGRDAQKEQQQLLKTYEARFGRFA